MFRKVPEGSVKGSKQVKETCDKYEVQNYQECSRKVLEGSAKGSVYVGNTIGVYRAQNCLKGSTEVLDGSEKGSVYLEEEKCEVHSVYNRWVGSRKVLEGSEKSSRYDEYTCDEYSATLLERFQKGSRRNRERSQVGIEACDVSRVRSCWHRFRKVIQGSYADSRQVEETCDVCNVQNGYKYFVMTLEISEKDFR